MQHISRTKHREYTCLPSEFYLFHSIRSAVGVVGRSGSHPAHNAHQSLPILQIKLQFCHFMLNANFNLQNPPYHDTYVIYDPFPMINVYDIHHTIYLHLQVCALFFHFSSFMHETTRDMQYIVFACKVISGEHLLLISFVRWIYSAYQRHPPQLPTYSCDGGGIKKVAEQLMFGIME